MTNKIISMVIEYAQQICVITLLITIVFITLLSDLKIENKRGAFSLPDDDPVAKTISKYDRLFGYNEPLYILIESDSILDPKLLASLHTFITEVRNIEGVTSVRSIFDSRSVTWFSSLGGYRPKLIEIFDKDGRSRLPQARVNELLSSEPLYNKTVVSAESNHQVVVINLKNLQSGGIYSAQERALATNDIIHLLEPIANEYRVSLAGTPTFDRALQAKLQQSVRLFVPLSVVVTILLMVIVFRSLRPVLLVTLLGSITLVWALGIMSAAGASISLSTAMIIPVIMTISAASAMHYLVFYIDHYRPGGDKHAIMRRTMAIVFKPSVFCSITTMVGFLTLCTSQLWGIRNLGLYMAVGVACSFFTANIFLPATMLLILRPSRSEPRFLSRVSAIANSIGALSYRHFRGVSWVLAGSLLVGVLGLSQLNVETNQFEYFGNKEQIRLDHVRIDEKVSGTLPIDIFVSSTLDSLSARAGNLIRFRDSLENMPYFGSSTSLFDFLTLMENAKPKSSARARFPFDLTRNLFQKSFWSQLDENGDLSDYMYIEGDDVILRIAGRLPVQGSRALSTILTNIEELSSELLPGVQTELSGTVPLFVKMQQYVIRTQIISLSISFLTVLILFVIISGSWKSGLAAVVANSLAVFFILGIMGFCNIALDVTTVMIAAVAIGIAADDTIHFLYRYKRETADGLSSSTAIDNVFKVIGSPVITTSLILTAGLAVLAFSSFVPIRNFGLLIALVVVLALTADLVLVPAFIRVLTITPSSTSRKVA